MFPCTRRTQFWQPKRKLSAQCPTKVEIFLKILIFLLHIFAWTRRMQFWQKIRSFFSELVCKFCVAFCFKWILASFINVPLDFFSVVVILKTKSLHYRSSGSNSTTTRLLKCVSHFYQFLRRKVHFLTAVSVVFGAKKFTVEHHRVLLSNLTLSSSFLQKIQKFWNDL